MSTRHEYRPGVGRLTLEVVREVGDDLEVGGRPAWHYMLGALPDGRWVYLDGELRTVWEFRPLVKTSLSTYGVVGELRPISSLQVNLGEVRAPLGAPYYIACSRDLERASRRTYERYGVEYRDVDSCEPEVIWSLEVREKTLWRALLGWSLANTTPYVL